MLLYACMQTHTLMIQSKVRPDEADFTRTGGNLSRYEQGDKGGYHR